MKKIIPLIVLFVFALQNAVSAGNQQIKYRIQCATSADKDLMSKLSEVPELKSFTLPSGSKIYFSGGYFNKYLIAKARLEEVKSAGFKSAFIRVFKYNNMLSKPVGDHYIENAKNKLLLEISRAKDTSNLNRAQVKSKPATTRKLYTRAEVEAMKKKAAERKAKVEESKVKEIVKVEEKKEEEIEPIAEVKQEKKEEKKENMVTEPPVYKIMLGKSKSKNDQFEAVSQLNNEIIYTYEVRNEIIYAVGFYGNEAAAKSALAKFKKSAKDAEVIGIYKGRVISLKLANQLYEQFNSQSN